MKLASRLIAALLTAALAFALCVPALSMSALDYNEHDVEKLAAFFSQEGGSGFLNGRVINGSGFDISDPSTWTKCTWDSQGRLYSLAFENLGWNVAGDLDLSGCTGLHTLTARDCELSSVNVSDCTSLDSLYITGNLITSLEFANTPALSVLWVNRNGLTSLDVTQNPLLTSIDCSYTEVSELDLSACPDLTVLRCNNSPISVLDAAACPGLTELNCKSTLVSELDITPLASLRVLYCFNTFITYLDARVFNGGESFVIEAVGSGSIGCRTYFGSTTTYKASSRELEGVFRGWYLDGELVSEDADFSLTFENVPTHLVAYFYERGDVDHSMGVDSVDALLTLRHALDIIGADGLDTVLADYDQSGNVDSVDALLILRRALGIGR